jgi:protein-L-isoaspartate O-methyltransferase
MKQFILQLYSRFISAVPAFERKSQLVCAALSTAATSAAAINWPGRLVSIGTISGYIAAIAAGIAIAMQFAEKTENIANNGSNPRQDH